MNVDTTSHRPRLWLALTSAIALVAVGTLWPLQSQSQVCIMIYPAPPGCGGAQFRWIPLVAIGLIIAALSAAVVVYFTVTRSRLAIILIAAAIVIVALAAAGAVALLETGLFSPYPPVVY